VVKKLSQDKFTDFLKDGVDGIEDYILGKIKEFEEQ
jgi:hypothetical protein